MFNYKFDSWEKRNLKFQLVVHVKCMCMYLLGPTMVIDKLVINFPIYFTTFAQCDIDVKLWCMAVNHCKIFTGIKSAIVCNHLCMMNNLHTMNVFNCLIDRIKNSIQMMMDFQIQRKNATVNAYWAKSLTTDTKEQILIGF